MADEYEILQPMHEAACHQLDQSIVDRGPVDALAKRRMSQLLDEFVDGHQTWMPRQEDVEDDAGDLIAVWLPGAAATTLILHWS